jgi:hypothetical protein
VLNLFFKYSNQTLLCLIALTVLLCVFTGSVQAKEMPRDLIIINKKINELGYYKNGEFVKKFRVATGKTAGRTPEGTFTIANKIKNRPYFTGKIKGGDPKNPLGDRWLGLDVNGSKGTVYAIHGNNNSKSIGRYVSAGCVRMYNDDVRWLYDQVKVNAVVIITTSDKSFEAIATSKAFQGNLMINGEFKSALLLEQSKNVTFAPLRDLVSAIGGTMRLNAKTNTITYVFDGTTVIHKLLTNEAIVDGTVKTIQGKSFIESGITMIPIRDFAQFAGYQVYWNGKTNTLELIQ